jgi:hypothetical protein
VKTICTSAIVWLNNFMSLTTETPWPLDTGLKDLEENLFKQFLDLLTYHDLTGYISRRIGAKLNLSLALLKSV